MRFKLIGVSLGVLFLGAAVTWAGPSAWPAPRYTDRATPLYASEGMVVAEEKIAADVGARILADGGNAVDAAVATGFALAVTLPSAGNIGGGGFMLVYLAKTDTTVAIDYREMAPGGATHDMYLDEHGDVDRARARSSHLAAGVPGTVAGLLHAHEKYGSMKLRALLAPAIDLAEHGFALSHTTRSMLDRAAGRGLTDNAAARKYLFKPDGSSYRTGERVRIKDLAWSLKQISRHGADAFYRGAIADLLAAEMVRGGGLINHQDLANYHVVEREPIWGSFGDYRIASMPPPSSGGLHLIQILNVMEGYALAELGHNSADYLHRLTESMRVAFADRSRYLGDPDFVDVPVAALTSKDYAARIRRSIDPHKARSSEELAPGAFLFPESMQTTHYSIADRFGNVIANTYTLNGSFGSGIAVPGAGFLLNNEMDDFSAKPGTENLYKLLGEEANSIAAAKRPLSSMSPTIVFREGKPYLVSGSPNGSRIITGVLQVVLNALAFDMNIAQATNSPRIHHQWRPDKLIHEQGLSADTLRLLADWGHPLEASRYSIGMVQSIMLIDGVMAGAADPRRPSATATSPELLRGISR